MLVCPKELKQCLAQDRGSSVYGVNAWSGRGHAANSGWTRIEWGHPGSRSTMRDRENPVPQGLGPRTQDVYLIWKSVIGLRV